ncbi:hypothetical protein A8A01_03235 [Ewingella americana]|nr:hypothetical protein A8A01_03235 [Ewingella americana]
MMDKNREAFEAWFDDEFGKSTTPEEIVVRDLARQAWQASRQAIEVDLENVSYVQVEEGTFYLSESDVNASLTSLGIRVKGSEE